MDQGDGQSRAAGHTSFADFATVAVAEESRHPADILGVHEDQAVRAQTRTRVAGDFLSTVDDWDDALLEFRQFLGVNFTRFGFQNTGWS